MKRYEFRIAERDGQSRVLASHIAANDVAALIEARRYCEHHPVEIWEGTRWVARLQRGVAEEAPETRSRL